MPDPNLPIHLENYDAVAALGAWAAARPTNGRRHAEWSLFASAFTRSCRLEWATPGGVQSIVVAAATAKEAAWLALGQFAETVRPAVGEPLSPVGKVLA